MPATYLLFSIPSSPRLHEILSALLTETGFEGFEEEENILKAYINENDLDIAAVKGIMDQFHIAGWSYKPVTDRNWNEEWEQSFQPVVITPEVRIRAPFHPADPRYRHDLVINPKMAFGTGHHATTSMMMELMMQQNLHNKSVIDYGTGTGILAILAEKEGAQKILAFDNDPVCVENSVENLALNDCHRVSVKLGEINNFEDIRADVVLANITRNTIIGTMNQIGSFVPESGLFIASGFILQDLSSVSLAALKSKFHLLAQLAREQWAAAVFIKY
ncbi:MAG: 50S ribosomal protein L11 methyltransferase [Bacteroidia bacterium]